jgi:hypothetical protein
MSNCGPINTETLFNETEDYGDHASVPIQNKILTTNKYSGVYIIDNYLISIKVFHRGKLQKEC